MGDGSTSLIAIGFRVKRDSLKTNTSKFGTVTLEGVGTTGRWVSSETVVDGYSRKNTVPKRTHGI